MPLQIRRGPTSDRLAITPLAGELVYDTTTGSVYVGNGSTAGGLPVTNFSVGDARTATAKMFLGESLADNSVHSGISYAYVGDRLQSTVAVNLSNYIGLIKADQGFKGNLWADDSGLLVNSETGYHYGTFQGALIATGDILPNSNEVHDIGSNSLRFKDLYLSGSSLHLGNAVITSTGTAIDLPLGTTVAGQPIGLNEGDIFSIDIMGRVLGSDSTVMINPYTGEFRGNLKGSVYADDSTMIVDGTNGVLRGILIGELQGNVVGNLTGTASTATVANTVALVATDASASTHYITFVDTATGNENVRTDTGLTYVPSTNTLSATFSGSLTGNVTGNVTGDVSGNAGTASLAQVSNKGALVASNSAGGSHYVLFSQNATGDESFRTDTAFYYNPLNNVLYADYFNGAFAGNLTGNVTGSVTGTIYTTLISSATAGDSTTGLTVTPPTTFEADVLMNSDLVVNNVVPETSEAYSLGSFTKKFDRLYLKEGANVLWLGNVAMSVSGSILDLPVGATVGGVPIPSSIGSNASTVTITSSGTNATFYLPFVDNITGNLGLYADNGISYNPSTNTLTTTTFAGNLTGNVTGSVTGQIFGSAGSTVTGTLTGNVVSSSSALTVVNTSAATAVFTGNLSGNVTGNVNGNVNGNVTGDVTGVLFGSAGSVITGSFTGSLTGDVRGSVFADDSSVMVNAVDRLFIGDLQGNVTGNLTGNVTGNVTGVLFGNAGSVITGTFNGTTNGTHTGTVIGDLRGSVFADDSSLMVDAVDRRFVGDLQGNVTGNLSGNVTGNVLGNLTGNVLGDLTGNTTGYHFGDIKGSVFGDDSSVLIDGSSNQINATYLTGVASGLSGVTSSGPIIARNDNNLADVLTSTQFFNNTNNSGGTANSRRARGTFASPAVVQSNDILHNIDSSAYDGSAFQTATRILTRAVGTISSGITPGQIEFYTADSSGSLQLRTSITNAGIHNFFGTVTVNSANLNVINTTYGGATPMAGFIQYHNTADASNISFTRYRGTQASPLAVQNGDDITDLAFIAYDGTSTLAAGGISAIIDGAVSTGSAPGKLVFYTATGSGGSNGFGEALVIDKNKVVDFKSATLTAGAGSGQVDTSAVATYLQVKIGGTTYAIPAYALNP